MICGMIRMRKKHDTYLAPGIWYTAIDTTEYDYIMLYGIPMIFDFHGMMRYVINGSLRAVVYSKSCGCRK